MDSSSLTYNSLPIKNWIISEIGTIGWSMVITRSLPELLELNPSTTISRISKKSKWSELEFQVIDLHLSKIYNIETPSYLKDQNVQLKIDYWELTHMNFFIQPVQKLFINKIANKLTKLFQ